MASFTVKPGMRLKSVVDATELVVLRGPEFEVELTCGGAPVVRAEEWTGETAVAQPSGEPTAVGKRYVDEELDLEVLCTKAGIGGLQCNGRDLTLRAAKPLPSTD